LSELTRRSCPKCAQLVVEAEDRSAVCPACGADVPPGAEVAPVDENAHAEALESAIETVVEAEVSEVGNEWNLGEPMHRVFALAVRSPHKVPAATMFRSSRWVFFFGVGAHLIALLGLTVMLWSVVSDPEFKERLTEVVQVQAARKVPPRTPDQKRVDEAQAWLCAGATLTPQQRVFCALDAAGSARSQGPPPKALSSAINFADPEVFFRPAQFDFWLALGLQSILLFALFGVSPLALLIALQGGSSPWVSALRVTAFAAPVWSLCCIIGGITALFAGLTPAAFYVVLGGIGWYLATVRGHLVRVANLAPQRAFWVASFLGIFYLLFLIRIAAAGGVA
jgi:hypothetical protein